MSKSENGWPEPFIDYGSERMLLGSMLLDPTLANTCVVSPSDFGTATHKATLLAIREHGGDLHLLVTHLKATGIFTNPEEFLKGLIESGPPTASHARDYERLVLIAAARREVLFAAQGLAALVDDGMAYSDTVNWTERVRQAMPKFHAALPGQKPIDLLREALVALKKALETL